MFRREALNEVDELGCTPARIVLQSKRRYKQSPLCELVFDGETRQQAQHELSTPLQAANAGITSSMNSRSERSDCSRVSVPHANEPIT